MPEDYAGWCEGHGMYADEVCPDGGGYCREHCACHHAAQDAGRAAAEREAGRWNGSGISVRVSPEAHARSWLQEWYKQDLAAFAAAYRQTIEEVGVAADTKRGIGAREMKEQAACVKCGGTDREPVRFHDANHHGWGVTECRSPLLGFAFQSKAEGDHLHYRCTCGWDWTGPTREARDVCSNDQG